MHSSVAEMEALCITQMHAPKSVAFVDELQQLNKRTKSVDQCVHTEIRYTGVGTPALKTTTEPCGRQKSSRKEKLLR